MSQVFFLTGSGRGLGRSISGAVLSAGHSLVATARHPDSLAVVLAVAGMADPPLRLILGSEAYAYAMAAAGARAASDAAWHDLTVSTDRDDATAAHRDPLGADRQG